MSQGEGIKHSCAMAHFLAVALHFPQCRAHGEIKQYQTQHKMQYMMLHLLQKMNVAKISQLLAATVRRTLLGKE